MSDCGHKIPHISGRTQVFPPSDPCGGSVYFTGVDDTSAKQGVGIDLSDGVHAYDGHGNEIPFTYSPTEIDKCDVGRHEVTYETEGEGERFQPTFPFDRVVHTTSCGNIRKTVTRIITIVKSLPPRILGIANTLLPIGSYFNPMDGVSGIDDNGNATEVTFEGRYDVQTEKAPIASFESDIVQSAKSLLVTLDPIQDLHGYDKPWVGGAGKNKYSVMIGRDSFGNNVDATHTTDNDVLTVNCAASNDSGVYSRRISVLNALIGVYSEPITYSFDIKASASATISVGYQGYGQKNVDATTSWQRVAITTTGNGAGHAFVVYNKSANAVSVEVKNFMLELGSSASSYEPYSNICPISGRTEVVTQRTGKNLLNNVDPTVLNAYLSWSASEGKFKIVSNASNRTVILPVKPSMTYTYTWNREPIGSSSDDSNVVMFDHYPQIGSFGVSTGNNIVVNGGTRTFTTQSDTVYVAIKVANVTNTDFTETLKASQLELGTTATSYEPYDGTTYTTDLGQTVYGGTLDVVSGELVVTHGIETIVGTENFTLSARTSVNPRRFLCNISSWGVLADATKAVGISSHLQYNIYASAEEAFGTFRLSSTYLTIPDANERFADVNAFKSWLTDNPITICYELATPQTYTLTPQQIDLLLGTNNVWSDGDVTVVYSKPLGQGATKFDVEGIYQITYHTEDECGNETDAVRVVAVSNNRYRTVTYEDGTFIINEDILDQPSNIAQHGEAKYIYEPMLEDGSNYVWTSEPNTLWHRAFERNSIRHVEIGSRIRPISTAYWFFHLAYCNEMDLTNLDTSRVTDMTYMFGYVGYNLQASQTMAYLDLSMFDTRNVTKMARMFNHLYGATILDVSSFDTSNVRTVQDMLGMFGYCNLTRTIYASEQFVVPSGTDYVFFNDCSHLVGGEGTAYNDQDYTKSENTYARIDNPPEAPGYFTAK